MRLHPAASRIARLAAETPALLIVFDALRTPDARSHRAAVESNGARRWRSCSSRLADAPHLRLSPATTRRAEASRWLARAGGGALDGVVAKRLDEPYRAGERAMLKIKCLRTADCVVGGFRYATGAKEVGSLLSAGPRASAQALMALSPADTRWRSPTSSSACAQRAEVSAGRAPAMRGSTTSAPTAMTTLPSEIRRARGPATAAPCGRRSRRTDR